MSDKIIVEFDREELERECESCAYDKATKKLKSKEPALSICLRTDNDIVLCNLRHILDYKIKEQNNEKRPKFKVGDKLYVVDCWVERDEFGGIVNDECFVKTKPLIVDKILIDRYFIFYGERDTQIGEFIEESHCFATQAEAQAECDKRNKGEK